MKKKIQSLGKTVTRSEMKNISGGLLAKTYWDCYISITDTHAFICMDFNPAEMCGMDYCEPIVTCVSSTYCPAI